MWNPHHSRRYIATPGPLRRGQARRWMVIGSGIAAGAIVLAVALNVDRSSKPQETIPEEQITELIAPPPLADGDLSGEAAGSFDPAQAMAEVSHGWIQVANPQTGALAQQYRFDQLDPAPDDRPAGWWEMTRPVVELHASGGRIVTLTGDRAVAYAPQRALESGTLTGNVRIRMFEPRDDRPIDTQRDAPAMTVLTGDASFDNFTGEVRCDGAVHLVSDTADIPAHDLRLRYNDQDNRVETMTVARVDYILLRRAESTPPEADAIGASEPTRSSGAPALSHAADVATASASKTRPAHPIEHGESNAAPREPSSAAKLPVFYRLTLLDDVVIRQGDGMSARQLRGDRLSIVFSMESQGLGAQLAVAVPESWPLAMLVNDEHGIAAAARHPLSIPELVLVSALASLQSSSEVQSDSVLAPGETLITCSGGMRMLPIENAEDFPASPGDSYFELEGAPCTFDDPAGYSYATAATMRYSSMAEQIDLRGDGKRDAIVRSGRFEAIGRHMWLAQASGKGGFTGTGVMLLHPQDHHPEAPPVTPPSMDEPLGPVLPAESASESPVELQVEWTEGVELNFTEAPEGGSSSSLSRAAFKGDVRVQSQELSLKADDLTLGFRPKTVAVAAQPKRETTDSTGLEGLLSDDVTIDVIDANGNVRVVGLERAGSIACQKLNLAMLPTADGRSAPKRLQASGDVAAADGAQTIWSDTLDIQFREKLGTAAGTSAAGEPASGASQWAEGSEVSTLTAATNVQVRLEDGARAFADRLDADAVAGRAMLTGTDVVVVSGRFIADKGTALELDQSNKSAHWKGPGLARILKQALPTDHDGRIERPVLDDAANPPQVKARWNDSLHLDSQANDEAGAVELRGGVQAYAQPSDLELNTMSGDSLTLEFQKIQATAGDASPTSPAPNAGSGDADSLAQGDRRLSGLIARGHAALVNRLSRFADDPEPRVFAVSGEHVSHSTITQESLVAGKGELLMRDTWPVAQEASTGGASPRASSAPFSAKGTTLFEWDEKLHMKPVDSDRFTIEISGNIRARHASLEQHVATLTGDLVVATVQRDEQAARSVEASTAEAGPLPSGRFELHRIQGGGNMLIRTPTRDVECDWFDYNLRNELAELGGNPGRFAKVVTRGSSNILRAERMEWNMQRDAVTIVRAAGSAGG